MLLIISLNWSIVLQGCINKANWALIYTQTSVCSNTTFIFVRLEGVFS